MNINIRNDDIFEMRIKDRNICRPSNHRRVLEFFLIQTGYSRPLIIGEFWSSSLYRQNYLAADHRRVLEFFLIPTKLLRC